MTVSKDGKEYNILGSKVKITQEESQNQKAQKAIDYVLQEASKLRSHNSSIKDQDAAVLIALKLATKCLEIEDEYRDNIFALKDEVLKAKASLDDFHHPLS